MARQMKDSGIEWIGEIPAEWAVSRVKYVSDFEPGCNRDGLTDESVITYTPMDCIKNGWFINNTATLGSVSSSLTAYQNGDIVMAKVTPCFENGNIAIMENLASGYGLGSSELFVFRPVDIDTRYFLYWLRNPMFVQLACSTMTGTGGLKRVSPYFAKNCYIHQPPLAEQHRIAAFLDRRCAEIDAVIERTKATIEEYKKLKQAVITEAVTKGVRGPRPMKDSGIEWIGEIPSHWSAYAIKYIMQESKARTMTGMETMLSVTQKAGIVKSEDTTIANPSISTDDWRIVKEGDIVFNKYKAHSGVFFVSPLDGIVTFNYSVYKCLPSHFAKYYEYLFKTPRCIGEFITHMRGVGDSISPLYTTELYKIKAIVPPIEEQEEIVAYLDEKCSALDTLIAKKTALLTELETYKKSLIYEYVTGKKEV